MIGTPHYTHDCDSCEYLGQYDHNDRVFDLYYCPRCDEGSVLARYSNEGSNYLSIMLGVLLYAGYPHDAPLVEAARRQIARWKNDSAILEAVIS